MQKHSDSQSCFCFPVVCLSTHSCTRNWLQTGVMHGQPGKEHK